MPRVRSATQEVEHRASAGAEEVVRMLLIDALVTVSNRRHRMWALMVDDVVLLRREAPTGVSYVVRVLEDPATQLWTAVLPTPRPGEVVVETLEGALAWLIAQGRRDVLTSDRWLTTAHGAA